MAAHAQAARSSNKHDDAKAPPPVFHQTKMCRFFILGKCRRGTQCFFAHSSEGLRPRPDFTCTRLCERLIETGSCDIPDCLFAHNKEQLRSRKPMHANRSSGGGSKKAIAKDERGHHDMPLPSGLLSRRAPPEETVPLQAIPSEDEQFPPPPSPFMTKMVGTIGKDAGSSWPQPTWSRQSTEDLESNIVDSWSRNTTADSATSSCFGGAWAASSNLPQMRQTMPSMTEEPATDGCASTTTSSVCGVNFSVKNSFLHFSSESLQEETPIRRSSSMVIMPQQ